ncbi:putative membrane protein [Verrucomicrobium sp. GAS474]|uniref:DUF4142 domain-containing protein n=1 Tax=Verrucomicrobium sp. GAS474 TaxID=1882831 RepID=UPI00087C463B|nr:DUF4142 domain-containing protein [Verrucomicrobium sp. GAS474]SDU05713.1 putative membrane protein [Verrucomicrobium sp. GAS474]
MQNILYFYNGARLGKVAFALLLSTVFSIFGTATAICQTSSNNPASAAQSTSLSKADISFLKEAYQGGLYEVEVGKYAAANGKASVVRDFGQQMATDHTALNDKLAAVASKNGVTLDTEPTALTTTKIKTATVLSGTPFDKTYARMAVHDHKSDIKAFEKIAAETSNPELKAAVKDALPTLRHHLMMAKSAKATLAAS